jgi:SAM-dependent methyltransferase
MNISTQWDNIAEARLLDRLNGNDSSYNHVFLPNILSYIENQSAENKRILDFGCGTGELTYEIAKRNLTITGLDISQHSIELAKHYFNHNKLRFIDKSLQESNFVDCFDIAIANMSLMDTEDLIGSLKAINKSLKCNGTFIVIITHPCYWPIYWEYFNDKDFSYNKECKITRTYKTSNKTFNGLETSHFHRPINQYLNDFTNANFSLINLNEINNPKDTVWYPRFVCFELKKNCT